MKKLISILLTLVLIVACFAACAGSPADPADAQPSTQEAAPTETEAPTEAPTETEAPAPEVVRVATLMGPTGMGMARLIDDAASGSAEGNYEFTVSSAPDQVASSIISGSADIAAVPVNLASVLWQKTEQNV